jgi:hypothetical protein
MNMSNIKALLIIIILILFIPCGLPCMAGVWKDDFSDSILRDWVRGADNGNQNALVENGQFHYKGLNDNGNLIMRNSSLGEIKSFTLKFEWKATRINNGEGIWGFQYRAYDKQKKYLTRVMNFDLVYINGVETITFMVTKGTPENSNEEMLLRVYFKPEEKLWHNLRLDKTDVNKYKLVVDDEVLGEFEDSSVSAGEIAFIFQRMLDIYIDDFMVVGPDVPDGGPGMKLPDPTGKIPITWGKLKFE